MRLKRRSSGVETGEDEDEVKVKVSTSNSYIIHLTSYILHPTCQFLTSYFLHPTSYILPDYRNLFQKTLTIRKGDFEEINTNGKIRYVYSFHPIGNGLIVGKGAYYPA